MPEQTAYGAAVECAAFLETRNLSELETRARKGVRPQHVNHASSLGDRCERRLYYRRVAWDRQEPVSPELQAIFDEGGLHEPAVIARINALGVRVLGEQVTRTLEAHEISGRPEGHVEYGGLPILLEVKSISPNGFRRLKTAADVREDRSYYGKWYGQVQTYLAAADYRAALLVLKDKSSGALRFIPIARDQEAIDGLLAKADRVNAAVKAQEPPPFPEDLSLCEGCPFRGRACAPPLDAGPGAAILSDPDLLDAAQTWEATLDAAKAHEEAEETIKAAVRGKPMAVLGRLVCTSKSYQTTRYDVPEDVRAPYARKTEAVRVTLRLQE